MFFYDLFTAFLGSYEFGDPSRTQTCDLQNRNLTFYSLNYGAECCAKVRNIYNFAITLSL